MDLTASGRDLAAGSGYGLGVAVSADDPRPPYLQVADDLRSSVAAGSLEPGQRLPSGRELSEQYGVALMTVQKALTLLRDQGVLVTHQGRGTFVSTEGAKAAERASPEFAAISQKLSELHDLVEETGRQLDARLTALEKAAGITNNASS